MSYAISAHDVRRLSVESRRDPRTVKAVIDGRARELAKLAVREAAERLGIALPTSEARST